MSSMTGAKNRIANPRGVRLAWERMFNSNFEVDYIYRDIDIDKERSGDALGLSGSDKDRLKRKGDSHQLKGAYFFEIGKNQLLSPQLIFDYEDLDGDAMKNYKTDFQLTYAYNGSEIRSGTEWFNRLCRLRQEKPYLRQNPGRYALRPGCSRVLEEPLRLEAVWPR